MERAPERQEGLRRGLAAILAFDAAHRAMTLADLARRIGQPRATVRRALLTLMELGFVEAEGRLFRLTPGVLRLAGSYLGASGAATLLQPACDRLSAELGVACSAAVLDGAEAVMVAYATPRFQHGGGAGLRLPAFCSAVGRVLLAGLSPAAEAVFLDALEPVAVTPRTVTDKDALRALLGRVRAEGHALADGEAELGFRSIAVPLRRLDGRVVAALNCGCAAAQASAEAMRARFLPRLQAEAAALDGLLL